jgi:hypothetical protein
MRTHSRCKVKHSSRIARDIHHSLRASCDDVASASDAIRRAWNTARARRATALMSTLHDGAYDAFIIWAEQRDDVIALECTITSGEARGEVVNIVTSSFVTRDPLSLVGMPCTLTVRGDEIRVTE